MRERKIPLTERPADAAPRATLREEVALYAIAFSIVAGLVHVDAAAIHFGHIWWYGALFTLLAAFQIGWGVQLYRRQRAPLLWAGVVISLGTAAVWAITRTVGVPVGPEAREPEQVGVLDVAATVDELAIVALAWTLLRDSLEWVLVTPMRFAVYATLTLTALPLFLGGGHSH